MGQRVKKLYQQQKFGLGCASISGEGGGYGFGDITKEQAHELLNEALDSGVRVFDTAPIYGFGLSEKRLGQVMGSVREKVHLISKCGVTWDRNKRVDMSNEPKVAQKMLETSLKDLNTDYIDLYMIHWPDAKVDIRKTMEVLAKARLEGKISHIGLCNTHADDFKKALEIDEVAAIQSQFNLFEKGSDDELDGLLKKHDTAVMSWGTLDKGILTGRVERNRKFDKTDCRSWAPWWKAMDKESRYRTMEKIWPLLNNYGIKAVDMAVQYNLQVHGVDLVLCGAKNSTQLEGVLNATKASLPDAFFQELGEILKTSSSS